MPTPVVLTFRSGEMDKLLKSPEGVVGKSLKRRATGVQKLAKIQVGVDTGALKRSITVYPHKRTSYGQKIKVGSPLPYALLHHDGSPPHVITPKPPNTVLRFPDRRSGSKKGAVVYSVKVNHPGTKPNRYLMDNLSIVRVIN